MRNAILFLFCVGLYFADVMAFPSCSEPSSVQVVFVEDQREWTCLHSTWVDVGGVIEATEVADPVREGYEFAGWYLLDGETPFSFGTPVPAGDQYWQGDRNALIVCAHWEELPAEETPQP